MQTPAMTVENSSFPRVAFAGQQELGPSAYQERRVEFEDLLSRDLPRFRRVAMRWLRNPEDAEDAVQDALLSAFKNIGRFEGRAQMSTWLMTIVINSARMQLRRRPRQQVISLHQVSEGQNCTVSERIADPGPTPERALEQVELRELVNKQTGTLPRGQRAAMQLREWDGLTTSEAAEALGVPIGTLKAQLARGRSKLTERLRKSLGVRADRISTRDSKARRKAAPASRYRNELSQDAIPMASVGFEKLGFELQGGAESWMGA